MLDLRNSKASPIGWTLSLLVTVLVFSVNYPVKGPMIQADESSYLLNAAAIAGFPNDFASSYHSGYSLLIAPAFYFGNTPDQVWLFVKIINSILYFAGLLFLFFLAQRVYQGHSTVQLISAFLVAAVYPMWVVMAGYAFAQIAFFAVFILLAYLVYRALRDKPSFWFGAGLAGGFLYWIHPTGVAVLIALAVTTMYQSISTRNALPCVAVLITMTFMVVSYSTLFVPWLYENMTISRGTVRSYYASVVPLVQSLYGASAALEFITRSAGHVFYLTIGTVGLLWAYITTRCSVNHDSNASVPSALFAVLVLSFLGVLALSVLLFTVTPTASRLDQWMHGRYVEGVVAPLILFGALTVTARSQLVALLIAALSALLLMVGMGEFSHTARMSVSAFWQDFYLRDAGVSAWALSGAALILMSLSLMKYKHILGVVFITIVFLWMSSLQIDWHTRAASVTKAQTRLAQVVRDHYPVASCVAFDRTSMKPSSNYAYWFHYGFQLYDYSLQRMSADTWFDSCDGPLFSYDEKLDGRFSVYLIEKSAVDGPILWTKESLPFNEGYPFSVVDRSPGLNRVLQRGWHNIEPRHVWSSEKATLSLPVPDGCDDSKKCFAVMTFAVFGASPSRPVEVHFETGSGEVKWIKAETISDPKDHEIAMPLVSSDHSQSVMIEIPSATSPRELINSADSRTLGIALRKIVLQRLGRREGR